jgi:hypothetical protein
VCSGEQFQFLVGESWSATPDGGGGGGGHWGRKSHKSRLSLLVARPSGGQQGEGGAEMFIQGGGATRIPVTLHLFAGRPQELAVKSQTKALA